MHTRPNFSKSVLSFTFLSYFYGDHTNEYFYYLFCFFILTIQFIVYSYLNTIVSSLFVKVFFGKVIKEDIKHTDSLIASSRNGSQPMGRDLLGFK